MGLHAYYQYDFRCVWVYTFENKHAYNLHVCVFAPWLCDVIYIYIYIYM